MTEPPLPLWVMKLIEYDERRKVRQNPTRQRNVEQLAGHFLRGHAGSVAYVLAYKENAQWDSFLGVDRARHTLEAFQKNYSGGICPRLRMAFRQHVHKEKLRFEEASRLKSKRKLRMKAK